VGDQSGGWSHDGAVVDPAQQGVDTGVATPIQSEDAVTWSRSSRGNTKAVSVADPSVDDSRGVLLPEPDVLADATSDMSSEDKRDLARGSDDGSVLKRCTQPLLKSVHSSEK